MTDSKPLVPSSTESNGKSTNWPETPIAANDEDEPRWFLSVKDGSFNFAHWNQCGAFLDYFDPSSDPDFHEESIWKIPLNRSSMIPIESRKLIRRIMAEMVFNAMRGLWPDSSKEDFILRFRDMGNCLKGSSWADFESELQNFRAERAKRIQEICEENGTKSDMCKSAIRIFNSEVAYFRLWTKVSIGQQLSSEDIRWWDRQFASSMRPCVHDRVADYNFACDQYFPDDKNIPTQLHDLLKAGRVEWDRAIVEAREKLAKWRNHSVNPRAKEIAEQADDCITVRLRGSEFNNLLSPASASEFESAPYLLRMVSERQPEARIHFHRLKYLKTEYIPAYVESLKRILHSDSVRRFNRISLIEDAHKEFPEEFWDHVVVNPETMPSLDFLCAYWYNSNVDIHISQFTPSPDSVKHLVVRVCFSILKDWWEREGRSMAGLSVKPAVNKSGTILKRTVRGFIGSQRFGEQLGFPAPKIIQNKLVPQQPKRLPRIENAANVTGGTSADKLSIKQNWEPLFEPFKRYRKEHPKMKLRAACRNYADWLMTGKGMHNWPKGVGWERFYDAMKPRFRRANKPKGIGNHHGDSPRIR